MFPVLFLPSEAELPPPYTAIASPDAGGVPVINCRVCQSLINLDGKLHQHVVKCTVCNEATVSWVRGWVTPFELVSTPVGKLRPRGPHLARWATWSGPPIRSDAHVIGTADLVSPPVSCSWPHPSLQLPVKCDGKRRFQLANEKKKKKIRSR